ncbi:hypothetical protein [Maridesulfovibrio frigidus]|uniref:hypothetical protein n=1 Tax=Maridesulfovibrio frigidus TaxID=340956 RepID=UPI0004E186ED|nr:hypothetical protein [Maridesulfovibrio frigidus]
MPESKPEPNKPHIDKNTIFWTIIVPTLLAVALYTYNRMNEDTNMFAPLLNATEISTVDK